MLLILWDRHVSVMWPSCEKHISLRENEEKGFSLLQDPDDFLSTSGDAFMQLFADVRYRFANICNTHTHTHNQCDIEFVQWTMFFLRGEGQTPLRH